MDPIIWEAARARPKLSQPLMVVAFEGWFDAGSCATGAVRWICRRYDAINKIAEIDLEEFLDFQETRPTIKLGPDGERVIVWPNTKCYAVQDTPKHHLVALTGVEPRMRWRTFTEAIIEIALTTKCQMIVTLGSTAAGVPHTRPLLVKSSAGNSELASRMGLAAPTYQGPTGVIGTLHDMADRANLPVISMRVGVPHYVAGPQNPKGTQALLTEFEHLLGVPTYYQRLNPQVEEWENRVSAATEGDPEIEDYISQLEQEADRVAQRNMESLPSGDHLAAEIEKFLSEQNPDDRAD